MVESLLKVNKERLNKNIERLAEIGKFGETGVCRLALSKECMEGIQLVKHWMDEAGLKTKVEGSVPMNLRRDALVGASTIISTFNKTVNQNPDASTVCTVGNIEIFPNARSIIPDKVSFTIDLRDINLERRNQYELELRNCVKGVSYEHGLDFVIMA